MPILPKITPKSIKDIIMNTHPNDQTKTSIFITTEMHDRAAYLARLQTSPAKARQVYANALAVCAIDWYCHLFNIPSSGAASEGLNPALVSFQDVSNLDLTEFGKLECRWARANDTEIVLPAAATIDRLGCIVVRFIGTTALVEHQDLREIDRVAEIEVLGFTPNVTESIALDSLHSMTEFLDHLEQRITITEDVEIPAKPSYNNILSWSHRNPSRLLKSEWIDDLNQVPQVPQPAVSRSRDKIDNTFWFNSEILAKDDPSNPLASVCRWKKLEGAEIPLALAVSFVIEDALNRVQVLLKVFSYDKRILPAGIKLMPLDEKYQPGKYESGDIIVKESKGDSCVLMIPLTCDKGERFITEIRFRDLSIREYFSV